MAYADLHIHSCFSDGTMSPAEILEEAVQKNIKVLSITDHDVLQGTKQLISLCGNTEVRCISGVELNAVENGVNYHILGYGFHIDDAAFNQRVAGNRQLLEEVNIKLIEKMLPDYPDISMEEYQSYSYPREAGGWKALHYFMHKGITHNLNDGFSVYAEYDHTYTCVNFPDIKTVCRWIHEAGGHAILAHPGKVIKYDDITEFEQQVCRLLDLNLDGIECYYPSHTKQIENICLRICRERGLIVTSGSDCHGTFQDTSVGQLLTPVELLNIARL